jgi:hypothetical protein
MSLTGTPRGTDLQERDASTQPLPVGEPLDTVPPPGAPTDPLGDRLSPLPAPPRRVVPRTVWFFVVVAMLVIASGVSARIFMRGLADLNPFKNGIVTQRTVDRSGPAVLKAVTDLGTLQSASGYYEIVIDVQKSVDNVPSFLAGRRVLFVAAGTVDASVDLRGLAAGAVTVDDARTAATIRLPRPRLSKPQIDVNRSYVYNEERGLVDRIRDAVSGSPDDQKQLYALASTRLTQAAQANDELVRRAEANTRATLQGLLRPLGFPDVSVQFAS